MRTLVLTFLLSLGIITAIGCPQAEYVPPPPPEVSSDDAKATLQRYAATGMLGSDLANLQTYAENLKAADAAKAEAFSQDLEALRQASGPDNVKAKAKELLQKL